MSWIYWVINSIKQDPMFWILNAILVATIIILFPYVANALAKHNFFFTTLESGDIKFVMRGETLRKILYDISTESRERMKIEDRLDYFKSSSGGPVGIWLKKIFRERLGLYWIGFPPFASIHTFTISREKENLEGKNIEEWIEREDDLVTSSLRSNFPRPFRFYNVELGDRIPVNVLVVTKLEVVDPYICIFLLKGKFFGNLSGLIQAKVSDILKGGKEEEGEEKKRTLDDEDKKRTLDDFVSDNKGEDGILKKMKWEDGEFNKMLIAQVGIRLVGISIAKYDPAGDGDIRKAMNAERLAQEQGKATKVEAEVYKEKIKIMTEADAARIKKLAKANKENVIATVEALALSSGSPDIVASGAASILKMEAATREGSKLTTLVEDGAKVVISTGGK